MSRKWKHLHQEIEDDLEDHNCYNETGRVTERDKHLLFTCVKEENVSQLRRFLDRGLNTDITNVNKQTPLHIAAGLRPSDVSKEILYLLISFGCAVDSQDRFGETALHVASEVSAASVQMLLDAGCKVNIQDNAGRTPLMIGCRSSSAEVLNIVQFLLDRGANISVKDADGQTALHKACTNTGDEKTELIYMLLYAGADVNAADKLGCTPADIYLLSPAISEHNSHSAEQQTLDIRPLVRGGAKFLETHHITRELINSYGVFLPVKHRVNVLSHLIHICEPVCRISSVKKVKHFIECLENPTEETNKNIKTLKNRLQTVRTLKSLCRIIVRDSLQNRIFLNTDKLKLPIHLEKYIQYSECV
ncbi:ankyrin repeat domain-containing protein 2-like [Mercenaria mercenaria]|uniref:ankyrin repeat domain-containing protein 2-like n=1 Tax=Mercenaria mercenaria TaxID=6596 RepID=UPI001E1DA4AD|nr:ankyrin repeat domain-containing protein 2-like [Mercenaria mercenaria]